MDKEKIMKNKDKISKNRRMPLLIGILLFFETLFVKQKPSIRLRKIKLNKLLFSHKIDW